jgi:hypothetical protein
MWNSMETTKTFLAVIGFAPSLSLANIGIATNCHVERSELREK